MFSRTVVILSTLLFSSGILFVSVLKAASINYAFFDKSAGNKEVNVLGDQKMAEINYTLPYPGSILPDSPLWPIKALRDKLWFLATANPTEQAELNLLFADKRLVMAQDLFDRNKPEIGFSVLTKAEKYLEQAGELEKQNRAKGMDTSSLLTKLANAGLKHREVIEKDILSIAPEDAKPKVVAIESYAKEAFSEARDGLQSCGHPVPENPFNGD